MPSSGRALDLRDAPDVLRRAADGLGGAALHELLVFTRCLFVLSGHGFHDCPANLVSGFLDPALGLEQEAARRGMFARLFEVVGNPAFNVGAAQDRRRRPGRRALMAELRRRSAPTRAGITQSAVISAERRAMPYYAAVRAALGDWTPDTVHYAPVIERAATLLAGRPAPVGVDIGCGYGILLRRLRERVPAARLVGSDAIPIGADLIAAHDGQPLRDRSCDIVISTSLPEMLVDPPTLVRECARLVKPGGLVIVTTATSHVLYLSRNPLSYVEGLLSTLWPGLLPAHHGLFEPLTALPMTWRFFTRHELREMFAARFDHVEVTTLHFGHLRKFGLERLAPKLPLFRHFGGMLMVVASGPKTSA